MDCYKSVLKRMDIDDITSFILCGSENFEINNETYESKEQNAYKKMKQELKVLLDDGGSFSDL